MYDFIILLIFQFDPETSPETMRYHGPPQVMLAYLKYQYSLGEDQKRKEAFNRLQVFCQFSGVVTHVVGFPFFLKNKLLYTYTSLCISSEFFS